MLSPARLVLVLALALALSASASAAPAPGRHPPPEYPTQVSVGVRVIHVWSIDDVNENFSADLLVTLRWRDPRLAHRSTPGLDRTASSVGDFWHPQLVILNQRELKTTFERVEVDEDGAVIHYRRYSAQLSSDADLLEFPFDRVVLPVTLISPLYRGDEVELVVDDYYTGVGDGPLPTGWTLGPSESLVSTYRLASQGQEIPRIDYRIRAQRRLGYYLWKVFLPLGLIVFMASTVFWIDPTLLGPQVSVATGSIFTLIAFQLSLGSLLPRLDHLTRADHFVVGCTLLVFSALGEAIVTGALARRGSEALAMRVDKWSRWIYPALFVALCVTNAL